MIAPSIEDIDLRLGGRLRPVVSTSGNFLGYGWHHAGVNAPFACEASGGLIDTTRWAIVRRGDLVTISPSLHCEACGLHGWVVDSTWRPS